MKRSHMKHHYKDSSRGFGVTSPLWDYIFNTLHKDVKLIDSNEISEKYVNNKDTI
jgi:sterol desaturase/sphingolipid hydroxylase (fatty acid hydroxylase superfamily)